MTRKTDQDWQHTLGEEVYKVTRCGGTERAFTGKYWNHKEKGTYVCICCAAPLFHSDAKYDSGSGWPSFHEVITPDNIKIRRDETLNMVREEVICANCDAHLGHVFTDGPPPTGLRYCINSASLNFKALSL